MPLMDCVGLVIKETLPLVVDILTEDELRDRMKVIATGKLVAPADVAGGGLGYRCRFREFSPRVPVLPEVYSGDEMQQEYLSDRHHSAS